MQYSKCSLYLVPLVVRILLCLLNSCMQFSIMCFLLLRLSLSSLFKTSEVVFNFNLFQDRRLLGKHEKNSRPFLLSSHFVCHERCLKCPNGLNSDLGAAGSSAENNMLLLIQSCGEICLAVDGQCWSGSQVVRALVLF